VSANIKTQPEPNHSPTAIKDALDDVRSAVQQLHGALSDAAAKRGGAMKDDLKAIPAEAKAIADSLKSLVGTQEEAAKKYLSDAVAYLETTAAHARDAIRRSGQAAENSIQHAVADARAATQKISEAVAVKRSTPPTSSPKK